MSANLPPHRGLPFGLAGTQPVFDRATDMAVAMFEGYAAALAIVHQGRMWRTRDPEGRLPKTSVLAERVIGSGAPLWVEDLTEHPVSAGHPLVAGGSIRGMVDLKPRWPTCGRHWVRRPQAARG